MGNQLKKVDKKLICRPSLRDLSCLQSHDSFSLLLHSVPWAISGKRSNKVKRNLTSLSRTQRRSKRLSRRWRLAMICLASLPKSMLLPAMILPKSLSATALIKMERMASSGRSSWNGSAPSIEWPPDATGIINSQKRESFWWEVTSLQKTQHSSQFLFNRFNWIILFLFAFLHFFRFFHSLI